MTTECTQEPFPFHPLNQREVRGQFDGGSITSDAGGLLLREVEKRTKIIGQFASCFSDYRDPELVEHGVAELVGSDLRTGFGLRGFERSRGVAARSVGGKSGDGCAIRAQLWRARARSTVWNWGRRSWGKRSAIRKSSWTRGPSIGCWWIFFCKRRAKPRKRLCWIWIAPTLLCTGSKRRFFHGYYGHYCYLPLYIVCGEHVLCARLRPSNIDGAKGSVAEVERIVAQIRQAWPPVRIILRGEG